MKINIINIYHQLKYRSACYALQLNFKILVPKFLNITNNHQNNVTQTISTLLNEFQVSYL